MHAVMDSLHFFEPLPVHLDLQQRISRMIRDGYVGRNPTDNGFWKSIEACQVTLITEDEINNAQHKKPDLYKQLEDGGHRRNLVIQGLKISTLEGTRFRIGTAVFSYQKPRPPCGYLDKIEGKGMSSSLARNSGACILVLESGRLTIGDSVEIMDKHYNLSIRFNSSNHATDSCFYLLLIITNHYV